MRKGGDMKKKILCILLIFALILSGCSSSDETSDNSGETTSTSGDNAGTQAEQEKTPDSTSAPAAQTEETKSGKISSFKLSVNNSDKKLKVTRAGNAGKSMGESGVWTLFVYLCGTDLESDGQAATSDVAQMLESSGSDNVRFVIQTGGTKDWGNELFAQGKAERYVVQNGDINLVDTVDLKNMGDADTLASFLKWGVSNYASEKMGLVFWDHGGGSITGVCVDELFDNDTLYLAEINTALSSVFEQMTDKFEFIGFDCCLMGTAETANILTTYARYMYGSQETEPGSGWNYTAISDYLVSNPSADGADLGKVLADSFYEECKECQQENECTMTVIDLSKYDDFLVSFNDYASRLFEACQNSDSLGAIVRCIGKAENFGGNNRSEGYTNMVDIGGIVKACSDYADPGDVLDKLKNCIVYNKNGSNHKNASGLSVYYPLQIQGSSELKVFSGITISPYYLSICDKVATGYTDNGYSNTVFFTDDGDWSNEDGEYDYFDDDYFDYADEEDDEHSELITLAEEPFINEDGYYGFVLDESALEWVSGVGACIALDMDGENMIDIGETAMVDADWETGVILDGFDGMWYSLPDGQLLCSYVVDYSEDGSRAIYTSPVYVNETRTNLRFWEEGDRLHIEGTWDGIDDNGMAARQIKKLKDGDVIVPVYLLDDDSEFTGSEYEWEEGDDLTLAYLPAGDYYYAFVIDDAYGDYLMTDYIIFTVDEDGEITFSLDEDDGSYDGYGDYDDYDDYDDYVYYDDYDY